MKTKETYELNGMVKIKVYENRKETGYTNIMIYNELGEHFVFGIDMCSQCCEDYELNIDERYKNFKAPNGIILVVYFDEDDYGSEYEDDTEEQPVREETLDENDEIPEEDEYDEISD